MADSISRISGADLLLMALSTIQLDLMSLIEHTWQSDPSLNLILQQKEADPITFPKY